MPLDNTNDRNSSENRKSNIGWKMTVLYSIVYGGFVVLSVFFPTAMGANTIFGLNIAVAYGLGLIIIAIIFAMIYNQLVRIPKGPVITEPPQNPEFNPEE